ncbi:hypothetical protein PIIN_05042 [Serendipita indica DSM 11827]|uniref:Uncharacterized protein n=1 Tax=Serendipita indica (strain DSM 11827) TaxID=1109443 RepID=G4TIG3_SERID|nr:hypothetical protein PIIN_05042 [Serendipita indica DSM 11827]
MLRNIADIIQASVLDSSGSAPELVDLAIWKGTAKGFIVGALLAKQLLQLANLTLVQLSRINRAISSMSLNLSHMVTLMAAVISVAAQSYTATYDPANLPPTTEGDQAGTNQCGTGNNQTSLCQNVWVNSVQDFCLWGPQTTAEIGAVEQTVVSYCTRPNRGTRLFRNGTIISAHFVETPDYIQITGTGHFEDINVAAGDAGKCEHPSSVIL